MRLDVIFVAWLRYIYINQLTQTQWKRKKK